MATIKVITEKYMFCKQNLLSSNNKLDLSAGSYQYKVCSMESLDNSP